MNNSILSKTITREVILDMEAEFEKATKDVNDAKELVDSPQPLEKALIHHESCANRLAESYFYMVKQKKLEVCQLRLEIDQLQRDPNHDSSLVEEKLKAVELCKSSIESDLQKALGHVNTAIEADIEFRAMNRSETETKHRIRASEYQIRRLILKFNIEMEQRYADGTLVQDEQNTSLTVDQLTDISRDRGTDNSLKIKVLREIANITNKYEDRCRYARLLTNGEYGERAYYRLLSSFDANDAACLMYYATMGDDNPFYFYYNKAQADLEKAINDSNSIKRYALEKELRNYNQAKEWLQRAIDLGSPGAFELMQKLTENEESKENSLDAVSETSAESMTYEEEREKSKINEPSKLDEEEMIDRASKLSEANKEESEISETSKTSEESEMSRLDESSETRRGYDLGEESDVGEVSDGSEASKLSAASEVSEESELNGVSEMSEDTSEVNDASEVGELSAANEVSEASEVSKDTSEENTPDETNQMMVSISAIKTLPQGPQKHPKHLKPPKPPKPPKHLKHSKGSRRSRLIKLRRRITSWIKSFGKKRSHVESLRRTPRDGGNPMGLY